MSDRNSKARKRGRGRGGHKSHDERPKNQGVGAGEGVGAVVGNGVVNVVGDIAGDSDGGDGSSVSSEDSKNHDYCEDCGLSGDLVLCDGCPAAHHFECLTKKAGYEGPDTVEQLPARWLCEYCMKGSGGQKDVRSNKRSREQKFCPLDSDVPKILLIAASHSPWTFARREQRDKWNHVVKLCNNHHLAISSSAKQLGIWCTKICEVHFMENPAVWIAPSSVLDHFTKDWLMYRLSTGKVSEKSKRHQQLAKSVKACSCHYLGQVLPKHNAVARASTTESPSGSSQSVPSGSVSSSNAGIAVSAIQALQAMASNSTLIPAQFDTFSTKLLELEKATCGEPTILDMYVLQIMRTLGVSRIADLRELPDKAEDECGLPVLHRSRLRSIIRSDSFLAPP